MGLGGFPDDPYPRSSDGLPKKVEQEADALLARLAQCGIKVPDASKGSMNLAFSNDEIDQARRWWERVTDGRYPVPLTVAIGPGAKWSSKRWMPDRYEELGRMLWKRKGLLPIVFGGPEDRDVAQSLVRNWGFGVCAAGKLSVRQSAAVLRSVTMYVGNDTGTMHLAAAVGIPCVAVFSAQDSPGRWSPYGEGHRSLRIPVPCSGCRLPVCDRGNWCLAAIDVQMVYQACIEVLSESRK